MKKLVGRLRIELRTHGLKARCSTTELTAHRSAMILNQIKVQDFFSINFENFLSPRRITP